MNELSNTPDAATELPISLDNAFTVLDHLGLITRLGEIKRLVSVRRYPAEWFEERLSLVIEANTIIQKLKELPIVIPVEENSSQTDLEPVLEDSESAVVELSDNPNDENYRYKDTGYIAGSRKELATSIFRQAKLTGTQLLTTDIDWEEIESNPRLAESLITKSSVFGKSDWGKLKAEGIPSNVAYLANAVYRNIPKASAVNTPEGRKRYVKALQTIRERMEACKSVEELMAELREISQEADGFYVSSDVSDQLKALAIKAATTSGVDWRETMINARELMKNNGVAVQYARRQQSEESLMWDTLGNGFAKMLPNSWNINASTKSKSFSTHYATAKAMSGDDWSWAKLDDSNDSEQSADEPKPRTSRQTFKLLVAEQCIRVGGVDINVQSTQELKDLLGFRDIQSGNWVLRDIESADFHVKQTAAAMLDMSDILGIDARTLVFNGRLAMAFGARGSGGALAHYEPIERVINITKMRGGGSLGHEWGHAMDNIMCEMMGAERTGTDNFPSENPDLLPDGAIKNAYKNIRDAMLSGDIRLNEKVMFSASHRAAVQRWLDGKSLLLEAGKSLMRSIMNATNATEAILAVDEKFGYPDCKPKGRSKTNWIYWRGIALASKSEGDQGESELPVGIPGASFYSNSSQLDRGGKKYWSSGREMFARAFQAYLQDKLAEKERRNDYLSFGADNESYDTHKPFPAGEERIKINAAFDQLFEALRNERLFEKTMDNQKLLDSIFGC